jgi:hypothetical protein
MHQLARHRQRHAAELVTLHQVAGDRRVRGLTARRAALRPAATISRSELSPPIGDLHRGTAAGSETPRVGCDRHSPTRPDAF